MHTQIEPKIYFLKASLTISLFQDRIHTRIYSNKYAPQGGQVEQDHHLRRAEVLSPGLCGQARAPADGHLSEHCGASSGENFSSNLSSRSGNLCLSFCPLQQSFLQASFYHSSVFLQSFFSISSVFLQSFSLHYCFCLQVLCICLSLCCTNQRLKV